MKKIVFVIMILLVTGSAYAEVNVSIGVGQPGFYGQINIGSAPQPELINPTPVVIQPGPPGVLGEPMYLHVPPGYVKNWRKYCGRYNACGHPVYFVSNKWYNKVYVPHYRTHRDEYRKGMHVDKHDRDRGKKDDRERDNR